MTTPIEVSGLTKTFGRHRGIDDVSFTVQRGEVFGFLGPNGAGKSTTIRLFLGLYHLTAGHVRVLGHDPLSRAGLRRWGDTVMEIYRGGAFAVPNETMGGPSDNAD